MELFNETDLPPNLSGFKNMNNLLRCPICFDFLNISMMTKCSHNFCSLCIRKFLSYKLLCPVCNLPMTEMDLRNNRILDDLVGSFKDAKQQFSKADFASPPLSPATPSSAFTCKTLPLGCPGKSASIRSHFALKTPAGSPAPEANSQPAKRMKSQSAMLKEEPMDLEIPVHVSVKEETMATSPHMSHDKKTTVKEETMASSPHMSHDKKTTVKEETMATSPHKSHDKKTTVKVECPVCSVGISELFVNQHLDMCLNRGEKKESLRSSVGGKRKTRAKLVYTLLTLQELKRRLKECHLSVRGTRDQLIKRHQEFVHIYNAQCDSLNPKSAEDIAKEVEKNEKMRSQLEAKDKRAIVFTKNQTLEEIEDLQSSYRKQHKGEFSCLVAQVRGRLETCRRMQMKRSVSGGEEAERKSSSGFEKASDQAEQRASQEPSVAVPVEERLRSPSPTLSDVSISSSLSDIFHSEPDRSFE